LLRFVFQGREKLKWEEDGDRSMMGRTGLSSIRYRGGGMVGQ
jgi:hypothetical protein